jgi:ribosome recycling factor
MNEEIGFIIEAADESMRFSIEHLEKELVNIRAGRANPVMLKGVMIEYYGVPTPLSQVSNINTPDGRTITVQPWEKPLLAEIEKGILNANLGFNPMNNGESLIINVPPLTEERRMELVKLAKAETENAKVSIRNARKDANNEIKKSDISKDIQKNAEIDIQELTDNYIKKVDDIFLSKEKDILTL